MQQFLVKCWSVDVNKGGHSLSSSQGSAQSRSKSSRRLHEHCFFGLEKSRRRPDLKAETEPLKTRESCRSRLRDGISLSGKLRDGISLPRKTQRWEFSPRRTQKCPVTRSQRGPPGLRPPFHPQSAKRTSAYCGRQGDYCASSSSSTAACVPQGVYPLRVSDGVHALRARLRPRSCVCLPQRFSGSRCRGGPRPLPVQGLHGVSLRRSSTTARIVSTLGTLWWKARVYRRTISRRLVVHVPAVRGTM